MTAGMAAITLGPFGGAPGVADGECGSLRVAMTIASDGSDQRSFDAVSA
jgi:hypothetical protein